jgi:hypothetical protein
MFIKTPHPWLLKWLGPAAQLALACALFLERFQDPALDFPIGFLIGFSLIGSLAYLCITAKESTPQIGGYRHDRTN